MKTLPNRKGTLSPRYTWREGWSCDHLKHWFGKRVTVTVKGVRRYAKIVGADLDSDMNFVHWVANVVTTNERVTVKE